MISTCAGRCRDQCHWVAVPVAVSGVVHAAHLHHLVIQGVHVVGEVDLVQGAGPQVEADHLVLVK